MGFEPGTTESISILALCFGLSAHHTPEFIMKTETKFPQFPDLSSNHLRMVAKVRF